MHTGDASHILEIHVCLNDADPVPLPIPQTAAFIKPGSGRVPDPSLTVTAHNNPAARVQMRKQDSEKIISFCKVVQLADVASVQ